MIGPNYGIFSNKATFFMREIVIFKHNKPRLSLYQTTIVFSGTIHTYSSSVLTKIVCKRIIIMEINGIVWRAKREGPEFRTGCMRQGSLTYAKVLHCRQTRDVTTRPTHYPDPGYGAHAHCAHATASILCREPRCHSHAHYSILYSTV